MTKTENSKIKHKLKSYWYCSRRVDADLDKIAKLRSQVERMTPAYSLAPGGHPTANMEDAVAMIADIEVKLKRHTQQMRDAMVIVQAMIDGLADYKMRIVLQYRYVNFYGWDKIAGELQYNRQWVLKLHGYALINLEKQATKSD